MTPHTHAVPYHTLDHADIVGALGRVVRYPFQSARAFRTLRSHDYSTIVIRYVLARLLKQLRMHGGRQGPRRSG
jgi:hypothetical protein